MENLVEKKSWSFEIDAEKKLVPFIVLAFSILIFVIQFAARLNIIALITMIFAMVVAILLLLGLIFKRRFYVLFMISYLIALFSLFSYYTIFGADAGWGAFVKPVAGFSSAAHPLWQGDGNFGTRLVGNFLILSPGFVVAIGLLLCVHFLKEKQLIQKITTFGGSIILIITSISFVFTANLRSVPNMVSLKKGEDDYLKRINNNKTKENAPNVLFIMADDLGYADISLNGGAFETPNIDSIGEDGINFTSFYSGYSVCSPSRFAAFTGRHPYRGGADNVIFPTVNTVSPFAATRVFNSIEMINNTDGMMGDEITVAETFKAAGYATGIFGKWHLGDYGEYLPTNQGFDYFYGSHHVNDMTPFYHVKETAGEWTIAKGHNELKDQSNATKYIHEEINTWIDNLTKASSENNKPFFACYTTPWPHAPIFVGEEFRGKTGLGDYADCVFEFDHYLGKLFNTLEKNGVLDNTIIIFTSDNGPALEGSPGILRGGKYTPYEAGTGVPFLVKWNNAPEWFNGHKGKEVDSIISMVDIYPTLVDWCNITGDDNISNFLPLDRVLDGLSVSPILKTGKPIHTEKNPILHMKREKVLAIQYEIPVSKLKESSTYSDFDSYGFDINSFAKIKFLPFGSNDNPAFFNLKRKNYLFLTSKDRSESYNVYTVYPSLAEKMQGEISAISKSFKENRRGIK
ncbi:MAG: sulfatase-like hydrolase/transferase [Christensenellales bacterium]|nr:sulfatase-like hydrolase/transferase [Clostridiales bacterium]